jgi:hypothetical protein
MSGTCGYNRGLRLDGRADSSQSADPPLHHPQGCQHPPSAVLNPPGGFPSQCQCRADVMVTRRSSSTRRAGSGSTREDESALPEYEYR